MRTVISLVLVSLSLALAAPASAVTLIDVTNLPVESVIPQTVTFTATSTSTKIDFQGYQLPGAITLVNIFLGTTGATPSAANNLLGLHYTYAPSSCGSQFHAFEGSDAPAYGADNLVFEGACQGLYDSLSQIVNTTVGTSYTLTFSLSNSAAGSSGLRIFATDAIPGSVPEPATWAMMLLGFGATGWSFRQRKVRRRYRAPDVACLSHPIYT
jgi:PEP-CTERM motif